MGFTVYDANEDGSFPEDKDLTLQVPLFRDPVTKKLLVSSGGGGGAGDASAANQTTQIALAALTTSQLNSLSSKIPTLSTRSPLGTDSMQPTRLGGPRFIRASFSSSGSGLLATEFTQLSLGSGMAVSQANGTMTLTTGTTVGSQFLMRSVESIRGAFISQWRDSLSQTASYPECSIELADLIGSDLAYTVDGTGLVTTVTIPSNPFTSANIGQFVNIGALTGAGTNNPGRVAITGVSGNDVTLSPVIPCTWTRSSTTATVTLLGASPLLQVGQSLTVSGSSDTLAIVNGVVTVATQSSTAGFGSVITFTCLNAGATSGTLTLTITSQTLAASSSGTCTLYGWNSYLVAYNTASNTTGWFDTIRRGWGLGLTSITTSSKSGGQIERVQSDGMIADMCSGAIGSATTQPWTARASRMENIPPEDTELYWFYSFVNGPVSPAATTATLTFVGMEETPATRVSVSGSTAAGNVRALKGQVDVASVPSNQTVSLSQINAQTALTAGVNGTLAVGGNVATAAAATLFPMPIGLADYSSVLTRRGLSNSLGSLSTFGAGETVVPFNLTTSGAPADGTTSKTFFAPPRECEVEVNITTAQATSPTFQIESSFDNNLWTVVPLTRTDAPAAASQYGQAAASLGPVPQTAGGIYRGKTYGAPFIRIHATAGSTAAFTGIVRIIPQPVTDGATVSPFILTAANTTESIGTTAGAIPTTAGVRTLKVPVPGSAKAQLVIDSSTGTTGTNTVQLEGSFDAAFTNPTVLTMQPVVGGATVTSVSFATGTTSPGSGTWEADLGSFSYVRARMTSAMTTTPQVCGAIRIVPCNARAVSLTTSAAQSFFTSTTSAMMLAANPQRTLAIIKNNGAGTLYFTPAAVTVTSTSGAESLVAGESAYLAGIKHQINGIFGAAGTAVVTELT